MQIFVKHLLWFITENWREAEMGIGLLVKPRTMRERYKQAFILSGQ